MVRGGIGGHLGPGQWSDPNNLEHDFSYFFCLTLAFCYCSI